MSALKVLTTAISRAIIAVERKFAWVLFKIGVRFGFTFLYRHMAYTGRFIKSRTSEGFTKTVHAIVLQSAWEKRKILKTDKNIRGFTMRFSILLMEREIDRQAYFASDLATAWLQHYAIQARDRPPVEIPDFVKILSKRYNLSEIAKEIEISEDYCLSLFRDSFAAIRIAESHNEQFIELWDLLTAKLMWDLLANSLIQHSGEQAL